MTRLKRCEGKNRHAEVYSWWSGHFYPSGLLKSGCPHHPAVKLNFASNLTDQLAVKQLTRGFNTKAENTVSVTSRGKVCMCARMCVCMCVCVTRG